MASDDLDLEHGDPSRGDSASERRRRRRESSTGSSASGTRAEVKADNEVRTQIARAFDGITKNRYTHGDTELADALAEESDAMTEGFVTLTTNVTPLRMPVIIFLNLLITLMAFGRVGAILLGRLQERRARKQAEAAGEYEQSPGDLIQDQQ